MLADVVLTATTAEGVPEWLTYLVTGVFGSPFVIALGWVLVRAVAKRLGVQADTPSGTLETGATPDSQGGPEQGGPMLAPAERYDAKMAMIEKAFERQDAQIVQLATQLAQVVAERDRLRWEYEQATGRPAPGPPPGTMLPPPGWPIPGQSPGSSPGS